MFERALHHQLLAEGLEAEGVITHQSVETAQGGSFVNFVVGVKGRVTFDDGTTGTFSSKDLATSRYGDLDEGTIVPVRYDADRKHVVLDVYKLEAAQDKRRQQQQASLEQERQVKIAAADADLTARYRGGPPASPPQPAAGRPGHGFTPDQAAQVVAGRGGEEASAVVVAVSEFVPPGGFGPAAPPGGMFDLTLDVTRPGNATYTATTRVAFGTPMRRQQIANVGARLPLRIDPSDPSRVAIDMSKLPPA